MESSTNQSDRREPILSRTSTNSSTSLGDLPRTYRSRRGPTFPFQNTTRQKPRRWPLALRFIKGSIHQEILVPVLLHALFATAVVVSDQYLYLHLGLPPSIIPSLSIVVGLMLVFRNQTAYARFWEGRLLFTTMITSCRNLTRGFLTNSFSTHNAAQQPPTASRQTERVDTERAVKYLLAVLVATKNHLRGNWGGFSGLSSRSASPTRFSWPGQRHTAATTTKIQDGNAFLKRMGRWRRLRTGRVAELEDLVPEHLVGYEDRGVGVPLQFTILLEGYIRRGAERGWWNGPIQSQHMAQLNNLVDAYGKMETIRLTPVPVAILIHQKQVLALFGAVLPFAMVTTLEWWAIPISSLVVFTLYGIDGIASQLEDPFGYDRADIDMDALVEDIRTETLALLDEWHRIGEAEGELLEPDSSKQTLVDLQDGKQQPSRESTAGPLDGVAAEDWHPEGTASMLASNITAIPSTSASSVLNAHKRRGEEGGEWFVIGDNDLKNSLSWGTVRFRDTDGA